MDKARPFAGVPFLLKDLFQEVAGWPMGSGSSSMQHVKAEADSDVARRWREAGVPQKPYPYQTES